MNKAQLELARREAQLADAYADARAAREAGLGGIGRFNEQTIDDFQFGEVLGRGAVSKLTSPHIVKVFAVSPPDALLPYIVMERLDGIDLAQMLKGEATRSLDETRQIVEHIAEGLDAAHAAGIIHRDLKPSNMFATGDGAARIWKLLDFGASKWRDSEGTLAQDNVIGTPNYMAPEQALGHAARGRVLHARAAEPAREGLAELEAILAVALAKAPAQRFAKAGELARALGEAISGRRDRAIAERAEVILRELPWGGWQRR